MSPVFSVHDSQTLVFWTPISMKGDDFFLKVVIPVSWYLDNTTLKVYKGLFYHTLYSLFQ